VSGPPEQPFGGAEYPPLEHSAQQPDPYAPVDYPAAYPPLPPPVYPQPVGYPAAYQTHPAYQAYQPYDPYRSVKPPGTNNKAIAALVTALAGLMFCGLPSIAGLILGIIAMRECRRTGQDGYGLALAGTIVGGLVVALFLLYILFLIGVAVSGFQWAP
jgi:hypothetical protein